MAPRLARGARPRRVELALARGTKPAFREFGLNHDVSSAQGAGKILATDGSGVRRQSWMDSAKAGATLIPKGRKPNPGMKKPF